MKAEPNIDGLTTMAIAAVAIVLTQTLHEGTHALTCVVVGADLMEFSALHVSCDSAEVWQSKTVSGSAALVNLVVGTALFARSRHTRPGSSASHVFLWLLMLMNWLVAAGYLMFSGIGNVGDLANVIAGLEPIGIWRAGMSIVGAGLYLFLVWLALRVLGRMIGGTEERGQIGRAVKLGAYSYATALVVILGAGLFNPYGPTGLPAVAGLLMVLGGLLPLIWMMHWFGSQSFAKPAGPALTIHRRWLWVLLGGVSVIFYCIVLGPGLSF